jgi:hypothetical protein
VAGVFGLGWLLAPWRLIPPRFWCWLFDHYYADWRYAAMVGTPRPPCVRCGELQPEDEL